ncbi:hypothetical protein [Xaviernesmea oryzae]|nr:hypothetical protein [Xaviernesmea oryzae]SEL22326.1 hypothetical protein SAMN04487976_106276 [Xaviernesmea oryzae]
MQRKLIFFSLMALVVLSVIFGLIGVYSVWAPFTPAPVPAPAG